MRTTDWKFDFSSLPHWDNRNRIPFVYDEFFEVPQSDALCCIYAVAEVSMCNPEGFLAIIKTKEKPELYLNITEGIHFCVNFSVNRKGNLFFLQADLYNKDTNAHKRPIVVIDVSGNTFSYFPTHNYNPCYRIVELNENVFKIEADEFQKKHDKRLKALCRKKLRINRLTWYDLSELNSLPEMLP